MGPPGADGADGADGASPFGLNGNDAFYTAGNVGIGVNPPTTALHVAGTATALKVDVARTDDADGVVLQNTIADASDHDSPKLSFSANDSADTLHTMQLQLTNDLLITATAGVGRRWRAV